MLRKAPTCDGCPAREWGQGWVPPEVPRQPPRWALVGQGPGPSEAHSGHPFNPEAPAGATLTHWLHRARLLRSEALVTNVVWCWLPESITRGIPEGNREPTAAEAKYCYGQHLGPLLAAHGFDQPEKLIVAVGAPAARLLLGISKVDKYMGTFNQKGLPE